MAPTQNHGRFYLLVLFALFFFSMRAAFGTENKNNIKPKEFELVSKTKLRQLNKEFEESNSAKIEESKLEKEWVCDMYGARSRFQAEHGIHLYAFKSVKKQEPENKESQTIINNSTSTTSTTINATDSEGTPTTTTVTKTTTNPQSNEFTNRGAHIFKSYKMSDSKNELVSQKSALKETIRWTKKGELLGKLETSNNTLVAFSQCKPL